MPTLSRPEAEAMTMATPAACRQALLVVHGSLGVTPPVVTYANGQTDAEATAQLRADFYDRIDEQARILAASGWTPAMLHATTIGLAQSPELDDKVRYGRPITVADFERVRRRGETERRVREDGDDGMVVERVITTRSGYALKVAAAKLYTAPEMLALWRAGGEVGRNCDGISAEGEVTPYADAMFTPVRLDDGTVRFRLKA